MNGFASDFHTDTFIQMNGNSRRMVELWRLKKYSEYHNHFTSFNERLFEQVSN